jgi:hypothetical protein
MTFIQVDSGYKKVDSGVGVVLGTCYKLVNDGFT